MFLRAFQSGQPSALLFVPFFAALLWLKYLIVPQPVDLYFEPNPMPLYNWLSSILEGKLIVSKLFTLALVVISGLLISRLNTKFIILPRRSYLPTFLYLIIVSVYLPLQHLNPAVIVTLLLLISVEIMFDALKRESIALEYFMASFLISIACLFYARASFLMLIVWTALTIFRPPNWREWTFTILGFATPIMFLFSWYYLSGQDIAANWENIRYNFVHDRDTGYLDISYYVFFGYMLILILFASRKMISNYQKMKIYLRLFFRLNFWIFAFVLIPFIMIYSRAIENIYFLAVPTSLVLSYYFFTTRSRLRGEIMFGLILAGYIAITILN